MKKRFIESLKKFFRIGSAEHRINLLKKTKDFSIKAKGETYSFHFDEISEELYLARDNCFYTMVNWCEVLDAVARDYTYLTVYVLNPDEHIPDILELNHFRLINPPW